MDGARRDRARARTKEVASEVQRATFRFPIPRSIDLGVPYSGDMRPRDPVKGRAPGDDAPRPDSAGFVMLLVGLAWITAFRQLVGCFGGS